VPKSEVAALNGCIKKYSIEEHDLFNEYTDEFYLFREDCNDKTKIKSAILKNSGVNAADQRIHNSFESFWIKAGEDINNIQSDVKIYDYKRRYTQLLDDMLVPVGVLDKFQSIGVFANWWDHSYTVRENTEIETSSDGEETKVSVKEVIRIKNVFKTINSEGFVSALVSDGKIADEHFPDELVEIAKLEEQIATSQGQLQEYVQSIEIETESDDENSEEKEIKVSDVKKYLKKRIKETKNVKEKSECNTTLRQITDRENEIKTLNKDFKTKTLALQGKIDTIRAELTTEQCEVLIMQLLHEAFIIELDKYIKAEVDKTIKAVQHLWDKYFVSANTLLNERAEAETKLNGFLERLGYING